MLPSEFSQLAAYPHLRSMLVKQVDMQFEDARALLRLPTDRIRSGCNLATAAHLFNLIAGVSVCLYDADPSLKGGDRGMRFRDVLAYFPWRSGGAMGVSAPVAKDVFYNYSRNPLAHALGIGLTTDPDIEVAKHGLKLWQIKELEDSPDRPDWSYPAIRRKQPRRNEFVIHTAGLHWGFHRLLHKLTNDKKQMTKAEGFATALGF